MILNKILAALIVVLILEFLLLAGCINSSNYRVQHKTTTIDFQNTPGYDTMQQMYLKYETELGL
ncbi:MAG: hypothetical protein ABRQ27_06555 [Clostridiaceae bacterium]